MSYWYIQPGISLYLIYCMIIQSHLDKSLLNNFFCVKYFILSLHFIKKQTRFISNIDTLKQL